MKRPVFLFSALAFALGAQAQTYYGNGYTIVEKGTVDDRLSGLDAMVFKSIDAYSVQEGLEQLLQGSGWALAGADNADPQIWRLYRQPWPDNKRTLNPMPLSQALEWVAGDGWSLVVDPVNRLVSFEVNSRYAARPAPVAATVANTPAAPTDTVPPVSGTTRVSPTPYDPYGASVSYSASPSYNASHDGGYTASANAVMVSPPDYSDSYTPPPRQPVRNVKPLRPAATNISELKTVSPGTAKTAARKRKVASNADPALLPIAAADVKTATRTKKKSATTAATDASATAAATDASATAASGKKATATDSKKNAPATAAGKKPVSPAATAKAAATTTTATDKTTTTTSKAASPAATAQKTTTAPATENKAATATDSKNATTDNKTTASPTPAATPATDANNGEARP